MAEDTQDRTEASASESKGGFRVPLSDSPDASVVPEFQTLDDTGTEDEPTETQASEQESEEGGDKPELPSAEELGVDENDPGYIQLRKKMNAAYSRLANKLRKQMAQTADVKASDTPKEPEQKQATPAPQSGEDDPYAEVYKVPFDSLKSEVKFRDGSDLSVYQDELDDYVSRKVQEAIQHTLNAVQSNDRALRWKLTEQQQINQARGVIEKYAQAIMDHPDYESKAAELAELAESTQALAKKNPEKWVKMAAQVTGLDPNWRDDVETEQAQRGRESVKLATKLRSVTPRGNTPSKLNGAPSGNLGFDAAFEAALRQHKAG